MDAQYTIDSAFENLIILSENLDSPLEQGYKRLFIDSCKDGECDKAIEWLIQILIGKEKSFFDLDVLDLMYQGEPAIGNFIGYKAQLGIVYGYLASILAQGIIVFSAYNAKIDENIASVEIAKSKYDPYLIAILERMDNYLNLCDEKIWDSNLKPSVERFLSA